MKCKVISKFSKYASFRHNIAFEMGEFGSNNLKYVLGDSVLSYFSNSRKFDSVHVFRACLT